jgi:hypothetical protein
MGILGLSFGYDWSIAFFDRFFRLVRFSRDSRSSNSTLETERTVRRALLMRSPSVLPGTVGAGCGFIASILASISDLGC